MENEVATLVLISGLSSERCKKVLEDSQFDLNTAAVILLNEINEEKHIGKINHLKPWIRH